MVDVVKRFSCDACRAVEHSQTDEIIDNWALNTEIGDLCPSCAKAWDTYKKSFIEKMRIDKKENL